MKNLSFKQLLFFVVIAFSLQSCLSNKAFQTARTTPQGDKGFGVGVSLPSVDEYTLDDNHVALDTSSRGGFAAEIFGRYGLTDKLDVGFNLSIIGTGGVDAKYQFLGDSESVFAGSVGAGIGYLSVTTGEGSSETSSSLIDISIPAYFSCHLSNAFALYVSPRFILRKGSDLSGNIGAIGGIRAGTERVGVFAEYGYIRSGNKEFSNQTNINVGVGFGIR